jgi:hypothetical protein
VTDTPRRRRTGRTGRTVLLLAVVALLVVAVLRLSDVVSWPPNPFAERQVDRSGPVLLQSIHGLSRYEAAEGSFQVVIDLATEAKFIPTSILGERDLFVALGTVNAYVDFGKLDKGAVTVSADRRSATVRLPHAALERANLDQRHSYLFAQQKGLVNRFEEFIGGSPDRQQKLYSLAQQKIGTAAKSSKLASQAEHNTQAMLTGMLRSLGYTSVTVTFGSSST